MSTSKHIWWSVRAESSKRDFPFREDAQAYGDTLVEDWKLVKVELDDTDIEMGGASVAKVHTWVVGGSATLRDPEKPVDCPWSARSGEHDHHGSGTNG